MFIIHFFDCRVSNKKLLYLLLQKIRRLVFFSCKLITFNSNWWKNSTIETAVDIFYSEILSEVVAYQHGVYLFLQIFRTLKRFLEVIYESSCWALINAVMKYLNFGNRDSKLESVTCNFTKNRTPSQ